MATHTDAGRNASKPGATAAPGQGSGQKTFVLVHGGFHGGWCWSRVARLLRARGHAVYTAWVNACGIPAVNLPCAPSGEGLPIGLQLVAGFGEDERLLAFAAQFEARAPWRERWPALAFEA